MKITLMTLGSRGDVQPFIALGLGLQAAGHRVRLATSLDFQELVEGFGLEHFSLVESTREVFFNNSVKKLSGSNLNIPRLLTYYYRQRHYFADHFQDCLKQSWQACQGADAIVGNILAFWGYDIAQKLNIPFTMVFSSPTGPTREFPHPYFNPSWPVGAYLNYQSHVFFRNYYWRIFRRAVNRWRQNTLGLPPWQSPANPFAHMRTQGAICLYPFSTHLVPRPSDWSDQSVVTGYWHLQTNLAYQPPADLVAFLAAGSPPIGISFGSMLDPNPEQLLKIVLEALGKTQQRGILLSECSGLRGTEIASNLYVIPSIPHPWLLPRISAFVHHGGLGTTGAVLRAGVPSIIVPFFGDHYFWGKRLAQLGAGPQPIPRQRLSVQNLSAAILEVITNREMQARVADLGASLRQENGVEAAIAAMAIPTPNFAPRSHP
jgi:sterol 3beta-glucosyltransferase